ncbi:MAG TPA: hypothetical protein VJN22_02210, partial [Candidatus Eremiobacteraceae bacterium]|nr:hypothetical protein [Candidatus Eremiobacteraceae bacterium]
RQFAAGDIHLAFYENFCVDPAHELDRLFTFLGRPYDEKVLAHLMRSTASGHAPGRHRSSATMSVEALTESWRTRFSSDELARANEIVASFGLERIYGSDHMPDRDAALATFSAAAGGGDL